MARNRGLLTYTEYHLNATDRHLSLPQHIETSRTNPLWHFPKLLDSAGSNASCQCQLRQTNRALLVELLSKSMHYFVPLVSVLGSPSHESGVRRPPWQLPCSYHLSTVRGCLAPVHSHRRTQSVPPPTISKHYSSYSSEVVVSHSVWVN